MSIRDEAQRPGWTDDTLVDRLDAEIQTLQLVIDHLETKAEGEEPLSVEESSRVMAVIGNYIRAYEAARDDWLKLIS